MKLPVSSHRRRARIEVVPLIDIMFFLLATFMMISLSMIKNHGLLVHLPVAASGIPQDLQEDSTITVTEAGEFYFNRDKVSMEDLRVRLDTLRATRPDPRIWIQGDVKASFGNAIEVLDEARRLGITRVAIQTRPVASTHS